MRLYLIRHGESEANATDTHAGWAPVNLTEKGRTQAEAAGRLIKNVKIDRLLVSDVKRAQQTAKIIFGDIPLSYCSLIREMNNTAMRGKNREEMLKLFPDLYPECRRAFDYAPLGWDCESGIHLRNRAAEFLDLVRGFEGENIAAVCHAGFIGACAAAALDLPGHNPPLMCGNASVSVLEYRKGRWYLRAWNVSEEI